MILGLISLRTKIGPIETELCNKLLASFLLHSRFLQTVNTTLCQLKKLSVELTQNHLQWDQILQQMLANVS